MEHDHNAGSWTVDVEGIGRDREVTGLVWMPEKSKKAYLFNMRQYVRITVNLRIRGVIIPSGTEGRIVGLRDPTLSPKHHAFLEVKFQDSEYAVWISLSHISGGSYPKNRKDMNDPWDVAEFEGVLEKTPTIH